MKNRNNMITYFSQVVKTSYYLPVFVSKVVTLEQKKGDFTVQWVQLAGWVGIIAVNRRNRWLGPLLAAGLASAMGTQLLLLYMDGLLTLETALPLHLCSLFGMLSIFTLHHAPAWLYETQMFLAAPAALITLLFPAVMRSSHPFLMQLSFYRLHVLLALMPFYHFCTGKPLPTDPRRALLVGSGYVLGVSAFNRAFSTNYLFLRAAPAGTPLLLFFQRGSLFYLCALVMLAMTVMSWLRLLYISAGNRSSCSRCIRRTAPCTSRGRG